MSKICLFPNYEDVEKVENISFSYLTEEQAECLCLALAKAGMYTKCFESGDKDLKWVVNVEVR